MRMLRSVLVESGLAEEIKWRQPCYTRNGANVAILSSFKDHCAVSFFKGSLLTDPDGILVAPGPNSQAARQMRFTSLDEVGERESTLRAYLAEAIAMEDSGQSVDFRAKDEIEYPGELLDAFDTTAGLREAFESLTPGRQRAYVLHFTAAKQSSTRSSRIERNIERIRAGKGLNDR